MRLKKGREETNGLPKMEDFASPLGDVAYCQRENGLLKESLETCHLTHSILQEVADDTSLHKADVLYVIGAIYIEFGAARIDEGTMVVEKVLRLRQKNLNQRKETDK